MNQCRTLPEYLLSPTLNTRPLCLCLLPAGALGEDPSHLETGEHVTSLPTQHPTPPPPISDQLGRREARSREGSLPLSDSTLALVAMVTNTGPASILLWLGGEEGDKEERREEEWKGSRTPFLKAQLVPACLSSVQ